MLDFHRIESFSMTYVFEDEADIVCEYEQIGNPIVAADGNSVTFTLKNIDASEDDDEYLATLINKGDDVYLKSTYFEDVEELYPLTVEMSEQDIKFSLAGENEMMYLYGFFA